MGKKGSGKVERAIYIENVYGTKKSGTFFLCLSKAIILFMVVTGTVIGFCDAFSFEYDKTFIILYTAAGSIICAFLFYKTKAFYIGFALLMLGTLIAFSKLYIYVLAGIREFSDIIRESYAEHYNQYIAKYPNPYFEDSYESITVTLLFIIVIFLVLYTVTIVRYMNFAETFFISFIVLEFPMYIGNKPDIFSVILVMAGCIACGMLGKGFFGSVRLPLIKRIGYVRGKSFKKICYTTKGNGFGVLIITVFAIIFSLAMLVFYPATYGRELGKAESGSIRDRLDNKVKIVTVYGIPGLYDRYGSVNGMHKGELGGVAVVDQDLDADLVVSYVPYSDSVIYIPGFYGVQYKNMKWDEGFDTSDYLLWQIKDFGYVTKEHIDYLDRALKGYTLNQSTSPRARMQITYVDNRFDDHIFPYYTFPSGKSWIDKEQAIYQPEKERIDVEGNPILSDTMEADYFIPEQCIYRTMDTFSLYLSSYSIDSIYKELDPSYNQRLYANDYLEEICLKVPEDLDNYLKNFIAEHDYLGLDELDTIHREQLRIDEYEERKRNLERIEDFKKKYPDFNFYGMPLDEVLAIADSMDFYEKYGYMERFYYDYDGGYYKSRIYSSSSSSIPVEIPADEEAEIRVDGNRLYIDGREIALDDDFLSSIPYGVTLSPYGVYEYWSRLDNMQEEDYYRLKVCEAVRDTLAKEYSYTLSPGKTPEGEDFVKYFMDVQKKGLCTHFASTAVMILRHLGIPARYVEGYCIPPSLVKQSGKVTDIDGSTWYKQDNSQNPDKNVYTVEVSDYYAHAWVEVYLEGKGCVPFEMTPLSYLSTPVEKEEEKTETAAVTQTPKPTAATSQEKEQEEKKEEEKNTPVTTAEKKEEHKETDLEMIIKTLIIAMIIAFICLMLIVLYKWLIRRLKYAVYYKEGRFDRLIYIRYCELVERLKKKKIVTVPNPLPMELCEILAGAVTDTGVDSGSDEKEKAYTECSDIFQYVEKVLYSSYKTNADEYRSYYSRLQSLPGKV